MLGFEPVVNDGWQSLMGTDGLLATDEVRGPALGGRRSQTSVIVTARDLALQYSIGLTDVYYHQYML